VEILAGDVTLPETLLPAMQGVSAAYYLIHSMAAGNGYPRLDLAAARHFAGTAASAGVEHIIYLGGLADPATDIAPHMRSRIETGEELRRGPVPVTEFRAGVIIGPGSISFEMIRFLTELMPVLVGPGWLRNWSQPIATENVIDYLQAALDTPACRGGIYEIGGAEKMPYIEIMLRYARQRKLRRGFIPIPGLPVRLMAFIVDKVTPVPASIAKALIEGLSSHSQVLDESARRVFPHIQPLDYDSSLRRAMQQLRPETVEPVWLDGGRDYAALRHEGFFIDHCSCFLGLDAERVFAAVERRSREFGSRWVESLEPGRLLRLHFKRKTPGQGWLEWRIRSLNGGTRLSQTAFFAPHGLPGFFFGWLLRPVNRVLFHRVRKSIS
jgi:uncharacterized protein YbjT (DUF2867 family)